MVLQSAELPPIFLDTYREGLFRLLFRISTMQLLETLLSGKNTGTRPSSSARATSALSLAPDARLAVLQTPRRCRAETTAAGSDRETRDSQQTHTEKPASMGRSAGPTWQHQLIHKSP